jgi:hypothetical protein
MPLTTYFQDNFESARESACSHGDNRVRLDGLPSDERLGVEGVQLQRGAEVGVAAELRIHR